MDIIVIKLIEKYVDIPFDVILYMNEFIKCEKLLNSTIHNMVDMWYVDNKRCLFRYGHISRWDVSCVTNMYELFDGKTYFNEDISKWDVSNVENMGFMFYNAESFNSDISNWNVSNVNNMCCMFFNAKSFNGDISKWDVSNVQNIAYICYNSKLQNVTFSNFISKWVFRNIFDNVFNAK